MPEPGENLGPYRIVKLLGRGGMGEVFLATDERLQRKVALKFLSGDGEPGPTQRERFVLEARAAARLDHPFVCKVYESGEAGGLPYIAMEYVEGQTLAGRIEQGSLTLDEAAQISVEIAEALEAAHGAGIVHRDLKPANVMLTARHAKVMDFGLAKVLWALDAGSQGETLSHRQLTASGVTLGTLAYMSPEQAQGRPAGPRSDIFSFGIVLHEMVTGSHPFKRGTAAETVTALLRDEPSSIRGRTREGVPAELETVLRRTLAKRPEDRYASARELADDLRRLRAAVVRGEARRPWRLVAGAAAAVALLSLGISKLGERAVPTENARPKPVSALVADFENATGDQVFDSVLEQAVVIGLEGAPFISAFPRARARQIAEGIDASRRTLDTETARLVAQREGIAVLVAGRIASKAGRYEVALTTLDALSGERLASGDRTAPRKDDVLPAIGALVVSVRQSLGEQIPDAVETAARETFTAASIEAAGIYARAQDQMAAGRWKEAIPLYEEAIALDAAFGRAYAGLAVCELNLNRTEQARRRYEQAFAHIDRMSDREKHRTRGGYYLLVRNYAKAIEEYDALLAAYPADPAGPTNLALAYFYSRDMRKALATGEQAVELYPSNIARANLALYAMYAGDFERASREARAVRAQNAGYEAAYVAEALSRLDAGDAAGARAQYEALRSVSPWGASLASTGLADVALYKGRLEEAGELLVAGIKGDEASGLPAEAARKQAWLAELHLARRDAQKATRAAEAALSLSQRPYVQLAAGAVLAASGSEKKALEVAARLAGDIEPEPRSYGKVIESQVKLRRGQPREAVALLRDAVQLEDSWLGRYFLGRAYLEAGAFAEAYAELEICLKRRGEATAVFLDDVPSYHLLPPVHYYLGQAQDGLGSAASGQSYRQFLASRDAADDALAMDARRRLGR